jgi:hypothetical protein
LPAFNIPYQYLAVMQEERIFFLAKADLHLHYHQHKKQAKNKLIDTRPSHFSRVYPGIERPARNDGTIIYAVYSPLFFIYTERLIHPSYSAWLRTVNKKCGKSQESFRALPGIVESERATAKAAWPGRCFQGSETIISLPCKTESMTTKKLLPYKATPLLTYPSNKKDDRQPSLTPSVKGSVKRKPVRIRYIVEELPLY